MTGQPVPDRSAVIREYTAEAAGYDRRWARYVDATLGPTEDALPPLAGSRLLDVGCGTGELLLRLARRWPSAQLAGVDLVAAMLAVARRRLGAAASVARGDAARLPVADRSLDVVVSASMLHYLPDAGAAIAEFARVLEPGGRLVVTDWCADYLWPRVVDRLAPLSGRARSQSLGVAALEALLEDAGFTGLETQRFRADRLWGMMCVCAVRSEDAARRPRAISR